MSEQQQTPTTKHPPTSFIFTVVEHMDDVGRRITVRETISGTPGPGFAKYVGVSHVLVRVHGMPGPGQQSVYKFPIEGVKTIEEAFAQFDGISHGYGQMHLAELRKQMVEAQEAERRAQLDQDIVVPSAPAQKKLILPGA